MTKEEAQKLVKTETVHRMGYYDFDRLVSEVYGHDFEIVAAQELGNDQSWTSSAKKGNMDKYKTRHYIDRFKETGNYMYITGTILDDLVENDYLPEGEYIIDIFW